MKILQKHVYKCRYCGNLRGVVNEAYNGNVNVYCLCDLQSYINWPSPCMICPNGVTFRWKPISDYKNEKGEWWHVPSFMGMGLNFGDKNNEEHLNIITALRRLRIIAECHPELISCETEGFMNFLLPETKRQEREITNN